MPTETDVLSLGIPLFVDPANDLAPQTLKPDVPGADSWFLVSNVTAGSREFGLLLHYVTRGAGEERSTISVIDVAADKFLTDIAHRGSISQSDAGFQFESGNIHWAASDSEMQATATSADGTFQIELTARRSGSVLAYNATGLIPLFGRDIANWQYAFPVMETTGSLVIDGERHDISGTSWFDRQWGPLPIEYLLNGKARWLWVCARLSNGDALALWSTKAGQAYDWLTILHPDGSYTVTAVSPVIDEGAGLWTSEKSGRKWHSRWTIEVPGKNTTLAVALTNLGQEIVPPADDNLAGPAIEGAVHLEGTVDGKPVTGKGFVEIASATDFQE